MGRVVALFIIWQDYGMCASAQTARYEPIYTEAAAIFPINGSYNDRPRPVVVTTINPDLA